ncbi:hypothetical protein ANN_22654 [Periplaneta americana]|uniref:Uncharacterized protein n=1 Tax=Periplaneta americana TaxID=6978 RepID=A0ABQ8S8R0_PERAM|nr:hypothetical protein ANN_22654 [Periplaneta americana]
MKNRKLGMEEEAYLSYKWSKDGKVTHDTERDARNLGPECSYKMCQNSKAFWKTMTWGQRTVHVSNLVNFTPTKRPDSTNSESRRKRTFVYNLEVDEKKIQAAAHVLRSQRPQQRANKLTALPNKERALEKAELGSKTKKSPMSKRDWYSPLKKKIKEASRKRRQ